MMRVGFGVAVVLLCYLQWKGKEVGRKCAQGRRTEHRELQACAARRSVAHDETGVDRT